MARYIPDAYGLIGAGTSKMLSIGMPIDNVAGKSMSWYLHFWRVEVPHIPTLHPAYVDEE